MAAGVGAALLQAEGAGAGALGSLGGAGPVGAPRAGLPARRRGWAAEAAVAVAVGLMLLELAELQVGDLNPVKTRPGMREREESTYGFG